ncbi:MAG TPA: PEP-CTERM sorting domain-containing protein [Fimbriimonadaceae bacterium]|nr:PEP-CTERM sorting domain-containing protein [Fimbriimonadaceae bacterium]HRJ33333.1 PEP-CTERM sorting domain-containing protein [Fimbriimonadaceae bacterium]
MALKKFFLLALVGATSLVHAQTIVLGKNHQFVQTGAMSVTTNGFFGAFRIDDSSLNYTSGSVLKPNSDTQSMFYNGNFWEFQSSLLGASDFAAQYPQGSYEFIAGGASGGSRILDDTNPLWPTFEPRILNFDDWSAPQVAPAREVQFDSWTLPSGANDGATFVLLVNLTMGTLPFLTGLPTTATSVTIPAGTLVPGNNYLLEVIYSSREWTLNNGIDGIGSSFRIYDKRTFRTFRAVPEPMTMLTLGAGVALLIRRRRAHRA